MANGKPWEDYTPPAQAPAATPVQHADPSEVSDSVAAAVPQEPWKQYQVEQKRMKELPYTNEMHPDIQAKDRFFAKNLASNPAAVEAFLKKRYPEHEITTGPDGTVMIRSQSDIKKGLKPKVLDPSGFPSSLSEAAQDVTDVGYDVARGVGTTAASTSAALGTLAAVPGAGIGLALPAGAAAAGAAGTSIDAARQLLGKAVGIPQDFSGTEALKEGGIDALSTLLFGSGMGKEAIKKVLVEKYGQQAAEDLFKKYGRTITDAGKGLPGKGWSLIQDKITPKIGETVSGVQADILRNARDNADALREWGKRSKTEAYQGVVDSVKQNVGLMKQEILEEEKKVYGQMAGRVPVQPIKDELIKYKDKLEKLYKETKSPFYKDQVEVVQGRIDTFFPDLKPKDTGLLGPTGMPIMAVEQAPGDLSLASANDLKRRIQDDLEAFSKYNSDRLKSSGRSGTTVDNELANVGKSIGRKINELSDKATDGAAAKVRKQWSEHLSTVEDFDKKFGNPEDAEKTLLSLRGPKTAQLQERVAEFDKKYGTNLMYTAKTAQAERVVSNAPVFHQSASGVTSTLRGGTMGALGAGIGYQLGQNAGEGQRGSGLIGASIGAPVALALTSPRAMMKYAKMGGLYEKLLSPTIGETIPQTLLGLGERKALYDNLTPKDNQ